MEIIEHYLTDHGGMGAFLALFVLKIGEMIWTYFSTRDANLKTLQCAIEKQTATLIAIQKDLKKFKHDLRNSFTAIKKIAGDKWPEIARGFEDLQDH
jgi:hypothetical protein